MIFSLSFDIITYSHVFDPLEFDHFIISLSKGYKINHFLIKIATVKSSENVWITLFPSHCVIIFRSLRCIMLKRALKGIIKMKTKKIEGTKLLLPCLTRKEVNFIVRINSIVKKHKTKTEKPNVCQMYPGRH